MQYNHLFHILYMHTDIWLMLQPAETWLVCFLSPLLCSYYKIIHAFCHEFQSIFPFLVVFDINARSIALCQRMELKYHGLHLHFVRFCCTYSQGDGELNPIQSLGVGLSAFEPALPHPCM